MKNSFIVHLGVSLWLASVGLTGGWAAFVSPILCWILGDLLDKGIYVIDLTLDSIKVGMQEKEFKEAAEAAYNRASARVYTEAEKVAIRQQYLDALAAFAKFGSLNKS